MKKGTSPSKLPEPLKGSISREKKFEKDEHPRREQKNPNRSQYKPLTTAAKEWIYGLASKYRIPGGTNPTKNCTSHVFPSWNSKSIAFLDTGRVFCLRKASFIAWLKQLPK